VVNAADYGRANGASGRSSLLTEDVERPHRNPAKNGPVGLRAGPVRSAIGPYGGPSRLRSRQPSRGVGADSAWHLQESRYSTWPQPQKKSLLLTMIAGGRAIRPSDELCLMLGPNRPNKKNVMGRMKWTGRA